MTFNWGQVFSLAWVFLSASSVAVAQTPGVLAHILRSSERIGNGASRGTVSPSATTTGGGCGISVISQASPNLAAITARQALTWSEGHVFLKTLPDLKCPMQITNADDPFHLAYNAAVLGEVSDDVLLNLNQTQFTAMGLARPLRARRLRLECQRRLHEIKDVTVSCSYEDQVARSSRRGPMNRYNSTAECQYTMTRDQGACRESVSVHESETIGRTNGFQDGKGTNEPADFGNKAD